MEIGGGSEFDMSGTIYLGQEDVWVHGDIQADSTVDPGCLQLIAGTFLFSGGPTVNLEVGGCGSQALLPAPPTVVRLVE